MKVWLLLENDRPHAGYVRAVFATNDDIEVSEDVRARLHALDFDIREWKPVAGMRTSAAMENLIIQEVRECMDMGLGNTWPESSDMVEETPPLDEKAHDHEHDADFCDKCMQCRTCDACECSPGQNDIDPRNTHTNKDHPDCPACRIERAEQDDTNAHPEPEGLSRACEVGDAEKGR